MIYKSIRLLKQEDKRIRQGHEWIFSNEIDTKATPLAQFSKGEIVHVEDMRGFILGTAYVNPHTLIAARMLARSPQTIDQKFFTDRIRTALSLRERLFSQPYYRLVYGESDRLPGLVIDRFGSVFVIQLNTAGMDRLRELVVQSLIEIFQAQTIIERSDGSIRELEGLEPIKSVLLGQFAENEWVSLQENGLKFEAPLLMGQKTGWFYDQRSGRSSLAHFVKDKTVLDVFSYIGAWGLQALAYGAKNLLCVDSSDLALNGVLRNAELNSLQNKVEVQKGDAFQALSNLLSKKQGFDVIIVDPPAFIKKKKDHKNGFQAYKRINELALKLLNPDGILIASSCSYHLKRDELLDAVNLAAKGAQIQLRLLCECHQGLDHPIHPLIPETSYIKTLVFQSYPVL